LLPDPQVWIKLKAHLAMPDLADVTLMPSSPRARALGARSISMLARNTPTSNR